MKLKKMFRGNTADAVTLDKEARTIEFPFSSEYPVERWFGKEVLSHDRGAMNLQRLNDGGALLWNHNMETVIGVVETAELRADKRIWAKARFSKNAKAQEVLQDIEDGILKNVSFGYQIEEMQLTKTGKDSQDEYTATKWMPFEVSIVSVPADPTVGIGRADSNDEIEVKILNPLKGERTKMTPEEIEAQKKAEASKRDAEMQQVRDEARKGELARISAIEKLGEKFKKAELARQLIEGGKTIDEARAAILESMGQEQKPVTGNEALIGLSPKEVKAFSFMRLIQAQMFPNDRKFQEAAAFEREVSDAAIEQTGKKNTRGYLVPVDVLKTRFNTGRRDMTVGTSTAGGNTVSTDLLAASFIELLRKKSVLNRAGVTMLNGLVGNIAIPRQSGAATAYWVAESGSPTEGAQTIDQVTMNPKTVGAFTDYSRKLLLQSSIDIEQFIRNDLATIIALELDRAGLYGSGSSNQPTGLQSISGVNTVDFAADAPTYAEIVSMESEVAADNADEGTLAYLVNARGRGVLKGVEKASSTGQFVWEPGNTVNGYRTEVSNQVSLVSGVKQHYWFGNWANLMIGLWSGLDVLADPYTGSSSGTVRIVALQDCDIAARHGESFCLGSNLT